MPVWAESAWAVAPWPMQLHARMSQLAAQCLSGEGFVLLVLQSSHLPVTYMARDTHTVAGRPTGPRVWRVAGPGPPAGAPRRPPTSNICEKIWVVPSSLVPK